MYRDGATLPNVKSFLDLYELLHTHISYPSPFWWVVVTHIIVTFICMYICSVHIKKLRKSLSNRWLRSVDICFSCAPILINIFTYLHPYFMQIALCFVELYVDSMLCKRSLGSSKRFSTVAIEALPNCRWEVVCVPLLIEPLSHLSLYVP